MGNRTISIRSLEGPCSNFQHDQVIGINEWLTSGEQPDATILIAIIACLEKLNVVAQDQDQPKGFPPLPAEVVCLTLSLLQLPGISLSQLCTERKKEKSIIRKTNLNTSLIFFPYFATFLLKFVCLLFRVSSASFLVT